MKYFELIDDWRDVVKRAHSMWAMYVSFGVLLVPEILFYGWSWDTNPRIWWVLAFAALVFGTVFRLRKQPKSKTTVKSPALIGLMALFLLSAMTDWTTTRATPPLVPDDALSVPATVPTQEAMPAPDAAFLAVAVPFVGKWEGLRLTAYLDIVGVPTVCYGETKGVRLGDTYSKAQCDAMFARELIGYRTRLHVAFAPETKVARLPVKRDVAFTSVAYNVGVPGMSKSTAVRRLNSGDINGACDALTWWNKAGGRVVRGLVNRRTEDQQYCMVGVS